MKRVILLFIAIVFAWFVGCVKEAELPPLDFKFAVDSPNESFADKGVNEAVTLSFEVKADYYFSKVPMKYKIETDKDASISVGEENILPNEIYTLENPKLSLSYVGKVAGQHNVKIIFFNGDTKKDRVTKEFKLKYVEYDYTLEELSGKHAVFQGESVDFEYKLTPKNGEDDGNYTITFKSYDEADVKLEKSKVLFNGEVITLNKSYAITDLSKFVIGVRPFHFGSKSLKYVIKNKTGQREGAIALEVKQNTLQVSGDLDKVPVGYKGEVVNFVGKIKKEPLYVRSFKYKTVLTEGTPGGVELNDWKEVSYNNDDISIPIKVLENGSYQVKVTFQDEFGNETEKIISINSHANYKFKVEIEGRANPFNQGEEVTYKINLIREDSRIAATYKIVLGAVEGDSGERATIVTAEGTKISENTYFVQTDASNPTNVKYFITVRIKSFSIGAKKLNFSLFRVVEGGEEAEKVTGSIGFEVQKSLFKVEQEQLSKNKVTSVSEVITHAAKIMKSNVGVPVKYKISVIEGDKGGIKGNDEWKDVALENGVANIPISFVKQGEYKYKVFYKDEFGNEVVGGVKGIVYRENEDFAVSFSTNVSMTSPGLKVPYKVNIKMVNGNVHSSLVNYYVSFNCKVIYGEKEYASGQEFQIGSNDISDFSVLAVVPSYSSILPFNRGKKGDSFFNISGKIRNSDGVEKNFESSHNPRFMKPVFFNKFGVIHTLINSRTDSDYNYFNHLTGRTRYYEESCYVTEFEFGGDLYFKNNNKDLSVKLYLKRNDNGNYELIYDSLLNTLISGGRVMNRDRGTDSSAEYSSNMKIEILYKSKVVYSVYDVFIGEVSNKANQIRCEESTYHNNCFYTPILDYNIISSSGLEERESFYYENYENISY